MIAETTKAIKNIRVVKYDVDSIPPEVYKYGQDTLAAGLTRLSRKLWTE